MTLQGVYIPHFDQISVKFWSYALTVAPMGLKFGMEKGPSKVPSCMPNFTPIGATCGATNLKIGL